MHLPYFDSQWIGVNPGWGNWSCITSSSASHFCKNIAPSMLYPDVATLYTPLDVFLDAPLLRRTFSQSWLRGHHLLIQGLHVRPFGVNFLTVQTCFTISLQNFQIQLRFQLLILSHHGRGNSRHLQDEQTIGDRKC